MSKRGKRRKYKRGKKKKKTPEIPSRLLYSKVPLLLHRAGCTALAANRTKRIINNSVFLDARIYIYTYSVYKEETSHE